MVRENAIDTNTSKSGKLECRTALVARELACYYVDIADPSEIRFSDKSQVTNIGSYNVHLLVERSQQ